MIPNDFHILNFFFNEHKYEYNFSDKDNCGKFTEDFLVYLHKVTGNLRYKHLRKYGSQTQYNKHAIDVLAYDNEGSSEGSLVMEVDILGSAESTDQIIKPTYATWQRRNTSYTSKDLIESNEIGELVENNMVPWVGYNEQGFERLKKMLKHDYERRPQSADFDVSVWAGRYFHNQYMGPNKIPLGQNEALKRIKGELCLALGISNDGYLGE